MEHIVIMMIARRDWLEFHKIGKNRKKNFVISKLVLDPVVLLHDKVQFKCS